MKHVQKIRSVTPISGSHSLNITWQDGATASVDLASFLHKHTVFSPLQDEHLFLQVAVGEWGWDITWGEPIEISAEILHRLALEQAGEIMPQETFRQWMESNQLSLTKAAHALGITRRTATSYSSGARPIPKTVMLACRGWECEE